MARYTFGGSAGDYTFRTYDFGGRQLLELAAATLTFWDSESGGTRHTDLLLNNNAVAEIIVDGDGQVPEFQGPDEVTSMWVDAGGPVRQLLVSPHGPPGPPGDEGDPGSIWHTTTGTPAGATGLDNDWAFDPDTGDVFYKDTGWSLVGSIAGSPGATTHTSAGVPSDGTGDDGDHNLDTLTGDYYEKSAGTWGAPVANLKGPQGDPGDPGDPGDAATVAVGTVTTVAPGDPADVTNSGTSAAAVLDFDIPEGDKGDKGDPGDAATVAVGTVDTVGYPDATVTNTGTTAAAVLDFEVPFGPQGEPGPPGPIGTTLNTVMDSGVLTLNPATATETTVTLTGDISLAIGGLTNGAALYCCIVQDGIGSHTATLSSDWIGTDLVTLSTVANTYNVLVFWRSPLGIHVNLVAQGALPASYFSPLSLADRISWYLAEAIAGEDGDTITTIPDLYGRSDASVINGDPKVRFSGGTRFAEFDGAGDYVQAPTTGGQARPLGYCILARANSATNVPVISGSAGSHVDIGVNGSGNWNVHAGAELEGGAANGMWQTVYVVANGASSVIRVDGVEVTGQSGTAKSGGDFRIGANDDGTAGNVDVAEVIWLSAALSGPDLADVENYLNAKRDALNGI